MDLLLHHSLAPLRCRRDIAMLGLLQRVMMGWAPACFQQFIYASNGPSFPRSLRAPHLRHNRQINDPSDGTESRLMSRSIFSLIYTYNCLPQIVVDSSSISIFQRHLQRALISAASNGFENWQFMYSSGIRKTSVAMFQSFFKVGDG